MLARIQKFYLNDHAAESRSETVVLQFVYRLGFSSDLLLLW